MPRPRRGACPWGTFAVGSDACLMCLGRGGWSAVSEEVGAGGRSREPLRVSPHPQFRRYPGTPSAGVFATPQHSEGAPICHY